MESKISNYVENALSKKIIFQENINSIDQFIEEDDKIPQNLLDTYMAKELIKNKNDKVPAVYYNFVKKHSTDSLMPEYTAVRFLKTVKSSRLIEKDNNNLYAVMIYADPKDLYLIDRRIGFSHYNSLVSSYFFKTAYNVKKFNAYQELRECDDIPIALFKEGDDRINWVVGRLKYKYSNINLYAYPVVRNVNGQEQNCLELNFSYPNSYKNHILDRKIQRLVSEIHKPIVAEILDVVKDYSNMWLLNDDGTALDLRKGNAYFFNSSGTLSVPFPKFCINYFKSKGYEIAKGQHIKDVINNYAEKFEADKQKFM